MVTAGNEPVGQNKQTAAGGEQETPLTEAVAPKSVARSKKTAPIVNTGLNMHAEHLHDFALLAATHSPRRNFQFFARQLRSLVKQVESGVVTGFNEKFDGSPAVVFGLDMKGKPFVAYKGGFNRKRGGQVLFNSADEIEEKNSRYSPGNTIHSTYADICNALFPKLGAISSKLPHGFVFQADVIFTENNGGRQFINDAWHIMPNTIRYVVEESDPNFEAIGEAKIGLFVHTPCARRIDRAHGRLAALSSQNETAVRRIVQEISSPEVFAVHPWHDEVHIEGKHDLSAVETDIATARVALKSLSPAFKRLFGTKHHDSFRVFFNSRLYPGGDGGIFARALQDDMPTGEELAAEVTSWHERRRDKALNAKSTSDKRKKELTDYTDTLAALLENHESEVLAVVQAYQAAIRAQDRVQQVVLPAVQSKIGGGEVEGGAISGKLTSTVAGEKAKPYAVKLVNRLDFTMRNNHNNQRSRSLQLQVGEQLERSFERLPEPLNIWRPDAHFFIGKMQFPHAGHVAMIRELADKIGPENVVVLASEKQYDPYQMQGERIKLASSPDDYRAGVFSHPFSRELRAEILRLSLPEEVNVSVTEVQRLWSYLKTAQELEETGSIKLVVGDKELGEVDRYGPQIKEFPDHLELVAVPLKHEGVSGTDMRAAVASLARGDEEPRESLLRGLHFVPESEKERIVDSLVSEYRVALGVLERTHGRW